MSLDKTDRELLELAALAHADPSIKTDGSHFTRWIGRDDRMDCDVSTIWNPLTDDGDALRLSVSLRLTIHQCEDDVDVVIYENCHCKTETWEEHNGDKNAATRRAIVRAAAQIGLDRKEGQS